MSPAPRGAAVASAPALNRSAWLKPGPEAVDITSTRQCRSSGRTAGIETSRPITVRA